MGPRTPLGGGSSPLAAAFSRAAGYCTEKSEGHWAGLGAQRGVAGPGFCLVMLREEDIHTGRSASLRLRGGFVGWISEYIGLIIPFAVFEDLPGSVCLWQRGRQGGGRRKPVTDGFPPASGKGVTGEPVTGSACLGLRGRLVPPAPTT